MGRTVALPRPTHLALAPSWALRGRAPPRMADRALARGACPATAVTMRGRVDGFGAQLAGMVSVYSWARRRGVPYCSTRWERMEHQSPEGALAGALFDFVGGASYGPAARANTTAAPEKHAELAAAARWAPNRTRWHADARRFYDEAPKPALRWFAGRPGLHLAAHVRRGDVSHRTPGRFTPTGLVAQCIVGALRRMRQADGARPAARAAEGGPPDGRRPPARRGEARGSPPRAAPRHDGRPIPARVWVHVFSQGEPSDFAMCAAAAARRRAHGDRATPMATRGGSLRARPRALAAPARPAPRGRTPPPDPRVAMRAHRLMRVPEVVPGASVHLHLNEPLAPTFHHMVRGLDGPAIRARPQLAQWRAPTSQARPIMAGARRRPRDGQVDALRRGGLLQPRPRLRAPERGRAAALHAPRPRARAVRVEYGLYYVLEAS